MKAIVIPQYTQRLMVGTFVAASFFATTVQANAAIQQPELDNSAFILIDYDTGTVLAQKKCRAAVTTCVIDQNDDQLHH